MYTPRMLVDTNTVDKTIMFPDATVRVVLFWKNVDGHSVERVTLYGTSSGLAEPIIARWTRSLGKIATTFSAPEAGAGEFIARLLSIARDISFPTDSCDIYIKALKDLESKDLREA